METTEVIDIIKKHRDAAKKVYFEDMYYARTLKYNSDVTHLRKEAKRQALNWLHRVCALEDLLAELEDD